MEPVVGQEEHRRCVQQELSGGHPVSLGWSSCRKNQKLLDGLDLTGGQDLGIASSTDEQKLGWCASVWIFGISNLLEAGGRMLVDGQVLEHGACWSRLDGRPVTVTAAATPPPAAAWSRHALPPVGTLKPCRPASFKGILQGISVWTLLD